MGISSAITITITITIIITVSVSKIGYLHDKVALYGHIISHSEVLQQSTHLVRAKHLD